eukprot:1283515-Prymnesium_polylepis.1
MGALRVRADAGVAAVASAEKFADVRGSGGGRRRTRSDEFACSISEKRRARFDDDGVGMPRRCGLTRRASLDPGMAATLGEGSGGTDSEGRRRPMRRRSLDGMPGTFRARSQSCTACVERLEQRATDADEPPRQSCAQNPRPNPLARVCARGVLALRVRAVVRAALHVRDDTDARYRNAAGACVFPLPTLQPHTPTRRDAAPDRRSAGDDGFECRTARGRSGSVSRPGRCAKEGMNQRDTVHAVHFLEAMAHIRKEHGSGEVRRQVEGEWPRARERERE